MTSPARNSAAHRPGTNAAPWRDYDRDDDSPSPDGAPLPEGVFGRPLGVPRRRQALIAALRAGR